MPECLKHCVWQDIDDPDSYNSEFKRILNSIYGQYDKPPIKEPPPHIVEDAPAFDGLARIDGIILEAICRIAIENEMAFVEGEPLVEKLKGIGITEKEITETQDAFAHPAWPTSRISFGPPGYCYSAPSFQ